VVARSTEDTRLAPFLDQWVSLCTGRAWTHILDYYGDNGNHLGTTILANAKLSDTGKAGVNLAPVSGISMATRAAVQTNQQQYSQNQANIDLYWLCLIFHNNRNC